MAIRDIWNTLDEVSRCLAGTAGQLRGQAQIRVSGDELAALLCLLQRELDLSRAALAARPVSGPSGGTVRGRARP